MSFKPILPGGLPRPSPTSTAHVHPHAHGGRKSIRGKGGNPGEVTHEESYADKIDEHPQTAGTRKNATSPGAGLMVPGDMRAAGKGQRPPMGISARGESQGQSHALMQEANKAKQALAQRLAQASPHAATAQLALRAMDQKLALAGSLGRPSAALNAAAGAVSGLDTKIRLGQLLAAGSPHLATAQAALGRVHSLTELWAAGGQ